MKIRFTKVMAGPDGSYQPGDVADLPDPTAMAIIEADAAVPVTPKKETAVLPPVEQRAETEPVKAVSARRTKSRRKKAE